MIFHVSVSGDGIGNIVFRKLIEQDVEGLAQNVGEHAETAAVGHAHDDLFDANLGTLLEKRIDCGDGGFATFEGEAFLADESGVEELLEEFRLEEAAQDLGFAKFIERRLIVAGFHAFLEPVAGLHIVEMHVFDSDGAAEGLF